MKIEYIEEKPREASSIRNPTVIKVIGVGGAGGNAVNCMINTGLEGVQFITVNTDVQALEGSLADIKLPIGTKLTEGLGAGGDPSMGEKAAQEDRSIIQEHISGADMVFVTAGMGGGTGTGAAPIIADIAKEMDILTVGVVTTPFDIEGAVKQNYAATGITRLRETIDTLLIIPNNSLFSVMKPGATLLESFNAANNVLRQGVQGISDLITQTGFINIDFADVRTVMYGKGDALMGVGTGNGSNRAIDATTSAISNPLLKDIRIDGARHILVNVSGGEDLGLEEFSEVHRLITANTDNDAHHIIGLTIDKAMDSEIKVTVIATGFAMDSSIKNKKTDTDQAKSALGQNEYVSLDEWKHIVDGPVVFEHEQTEQPKTDIIESMGSDLQIPAVLRQGAK